MPPRLKSNSASVLWRPIAHPEPQHLVLMRGVRVERLTVDLVYVDHNTTAPPSERGTDGLQPLCPHQPCECVVKTGNRSTEVNDRRGESRRVALPCSRFGCRGNTYGRGIVMWHKGPHARRVPTAMARHLTFSTLGPPSALS